MIGTIRRSLACCIALGVLLAMGSAGAAPSASYTGAGITVVKEAPGAEPTIDNGGVVCDASTGDGVGGACVDFGGGVSVVDGLGGEEVAFQVCIDNNGDGICAGGGRDGAVNPCGDLQFFSHSDDGRFFNPLGPLPSSFKTGCPGGAWNGYIVFLCEGVHNDGHALHVHPATSGTVTTATTGEGFGDFCGGGVDAAPKRYEVVG